MSTYLNRNRAQRDQVGTLLRRDDSVREAMKRRGMQPRDHLRDNAAQIREKQREIKEEKEEEERRKGAARPFKLKQFENVKSKVASDIRTGTSQGSRRNNNTASSSASSSFAAASSSSTTTSGSGSASRQLRSRTDPVNSRRNNALMGGSKAGAVPKGSRNASANANTRKSGAPRPQPSTRQQPQRQDRGGPRGFGDNGPKIAVYNAEDEFGDAAPRSVPGPGAGLKESLFGLVDDGSGDHMRNRDRNNNYDDHDDDYPENDSDAGNDFEHDYEHNDDDGFHDQYDDDNSNNEGMTSSRTAGQSRQQQHRLTKPAVPSMNEIREREAQLEERASHREQKDFVRSNYRTAVTASRQKPRTTKKEEIHDPHKINPDFGRVPKYVQDRKAKRAAEEEATRAAAKAAAECPPGMRLLPEDERVETLEILKASLTKVSSELGALPIVVRTLAMQRRKTELEQKVDEIETAIKTFSRTKVFVTLD